VWRDKSDVLDQKAEQARLSPGLPHPMGSSSSLPHSVIATDPMRIGHDN
jgi:hypothetical protein